MVFSSVLHEEAPQRSIKSVLDVARRSAKEKQQERVGCWMLDVARSRRPSRRSSTGRYYTPPNPPPPPKPEPPPNPPPAPPYPPTNVPTNGSAERHEELPKVARTSVETSATDHTRCSEVTMIWKEACTRRGLRRPSEPQKKRKTDTDPPQRDIRWLGEPQGWRVTRYI